MPTGNDGREILLLKNVIVNTTAFGNRDPPQPGS